jgi:hypothetical protein
MPAKRKSAYSEVMKSVQRNGETVTPLSSETGEQQHGETVTSQDSSTVQPFSSEGVEQQHSETVQPLSGESGTLQYGETAEKLYVNTVTPSRSEAVKPKKERKVSFYLTAEQEQKLDDLAYEYSKRAKKRINRNDIVRYLINQCGLIPDDAQFE